MNCTLCGKSNQEQKFKMCSACRELTRMQQRENYKWCRENKAHYCELCQYAAVSEYQLDKHKTTKGHQRRSGVVTHYQIPKDANINDQTKNRMFTIQWIQDDKQKQECFTYDDTNKEQVRKEAEQFKESMSKI